MTGPSPRWAFASVLGAVLAVSLFALFAVVYPGTGPAAADVSVASLDMVPPFTPAGPVIQAGVQNIGPTGIGNLTVYVVLQQTYTIYFPNVTSASPLYKGQTATASALFLQGAFTCGESYPVTVRGASLTGLPFEMATTQVIACVNPAVVG